MMDSDYRNVLSAFWLGWMGFPACNITSGSTYIYDLSKSVPACGLLFKANFEAIDGRVARLTSHADVAPGDALFVEHQAVGGQQRAESVTA